METWITIQMGKDTFKSMPKKNYDKALKTSQWLIDTAIKSGMTKAEAEAEYSIRIVKEYQSPEK